MRDRQGVAGAGIVDVVALVARHQPVIAGVVDAAKAQRRPHLVAFAGVIVDDVEDDLDPGLVQARHHRLELRQDAGGHEAGFGREEAYRVVAPVIAQRPLDQMAVVAEGLDRQKLQRGDAERAQLVDHRLGAEARESAAKLRADIRVAHGEAADMGFVDDGVAPGNARRAVVAPGEGAVDHAAFRHAARVVAAVERQVFAGRADAVAEMGVRPAERSEQRLGVGVDQQLVGIEAVAGGRLVRAVDAVAVERAGTRFRQVAVPDLVGIFRQRHPVDLAGAGLVEQAQLDLGRIGREQGEIDAEAVPGGAQRVGPAGPDHRARRARRLHGRSPGNVGRRMERGDSAVTGPAALVCASGRRCRGTESVGNRPAAQVVPLWLTQGLGGTRAYGIGGRTLGAAAPAARS